MKSILIALIILLAVTTNVLATCPPEPPLSQAIALVVAYDSGRFLVYYKTNTGDNPWNICTIRYLYPNGFIEPRFFVMGIDLNGDLKIDPETELFYPNWTQPLDGEPKLL